MLQNKPQIEVNVEAPTDDEIAAGLYSYADLKARGIVRDRTDLHRKQQQYGFPQPIKTGKRQAPFLKTRVHAWVRRRAALSKKSTAK